MSKTTKTTKTDAPNTDEPTVEELTIDLPQTRKPGLLARMLGRTDNAVITTLYTHALNSPLLIEPGHGERLIGAYMQGAVNEVGPRQTEVGKIAVMNIGGALVHRPMPGPSGDGPQNYEQLAGTLTDLVMRDDVSAIVLRIDSPGGLVSGCFDFSDLVFEARDEKPIVAVVDDIAFSAAYAIAAACDEIWISRTGQVGSIGAVAYHVDQSERDKAQGYKVTAIHAGKHKIDYSPHFALSEEAFKREQASIDDVYGLFLERVGAYRNAKGLDAKKAQASEALTYRGQVAIDEGFADQLGTLQDALSSLGDRLAEPVELNAGDDAMNEEQQQAHDRGVVTSLVMASGLSAAAAHQLLQRDLTPDTAPDAIKAAGEIVQACQVASHDDKAEGFIAKGLSVEQVKSELQELKAKADESAETKTHLPGSAGGAAPSGGLWDHTITQMGGTP